MIRLLRLFTSIISTILLISCVSPGPQQVTKPGIDSANKFSAWRLENSQEFEAINVLLVEVDDLIESNALNAAEDKLERILRVKSGYAPAWSRLSWLALETGSPKRAVQMAKRSNSFARGNPELQSLNWTFIRDASQTLNDDEAYMRANQKIDLLQSN